MKISQTSYQKTGDPKIIEIENCKSQSAKIIGEKSGLFYVPEILTYNKNDSIEFEFLEGLETIENLIKKKDDRLFYIINNLGLSLSLIHKNLVLPEEFNYKLPDIWQDLYENEVFIHGDLTIRNVCFHNPTNRLVILDWSPPYEDCIWTYGSRYYDITWFLRSLLTGPQNIGSPMFTRRLANAFINAYASNFNKKLDMNMIDKFRKILFIESHPKLWKKFKRSGLRKKLSILKYFIITRHMWRFYNPKYSIE